MKKRVFLALLAAAAVTFVGCSKDDDGPDEGPQTYTITFEGDDWSSLVVANYNGGKAMSVVYEDKAYTWTDQTTQLTSPCPEGWGYPFMVSSYNSKDIEKFNTYELDLYLYNAQNEDATTGGGHDGSDNFLIGYGNYDEAHIIRKSKCSTDFKRNDFLKKTKRTHWVRFVHLNSLIESCVFLYLWNSPFDTFL